MSDSNQNVVELHKIDRPQGEVVLSPTIFNVEKTDYQNTPLFLGQAPGLLDSVNKQYPEIWSLYKEMKKLDWDENEFDYSSCMVDFATCSRENYNLMLRTLAWQWEADSVASRAISVVMGPFISSSELWVCWQRISDNESIHALTYSEIVRGSFQNPKEVLDWVLAEKEPLERLSLVGKVFSDVAKASSQYAQGQIPSCYETYKHPFMFTVALMIMERLQFMASFAITFAFGEMNMFMPACKAIQKIAQDELEIHVELDKAVIRRELQTPWGKRAMEELKPVIFKMITEVTQTEFNWIDYAMKDGGELPGVTVPKLRNWVKFNARDLLVFFDLPVPEDYPTKNPLAYMNDWLDIGKMQPSPQEENVGMYKVNVMVRDDDNAEFSDMNF